MIAAPPQNVVWLNFVVRSGIFAVLTFFVFVFAFILRLFFELSLHLEAFPKRYCRPRLIFFLFPNFTQPDPAHRTNRIKRIKRILSY